jgi:hypothetical protein
LVKKEVSEQERLIMQSQDFGQGSGQGSSQGFGQGPAEQAGGSGGGISREIQSDAQRLSSTAGNRIHSELDARKGTAATQVRSLSSAIGQAGEGLDEGAPQWLRSAFQQGAQQAQRFADSLEQKDSREILNDIQDMARNNPGAFIAGCAAIGFAAARLFKAGAPDSSASQSQQPQRPPVQGEEPTFRSPGAGTSASASTPGEFV